MGKRKRKLNRGRDGVPRKIGAPTPSRKHVADVGMMVKQRPLLAHPLDVLTNYNTVGPIIARLRMEQQAR